MRPAARGKRRTLTMMTMSAAVIVTATLLPAFVPATWPAYCTQPSSYLSNSTKSRMLPMSPCVWAETELK
jgi:hypothetical protein